MTSVIRFVPSFTLLAGSSPRSSITLLIFPYGPYLKNPAEVGVTLGERLR